MSWACMDGWNRFCIEWCGNKQGGTIWTFDFSAFQKKSWDCLLKNSTKSSCFFCHWSLPEKKNAVQMRQFMEGATGKTHETKGKWPLDLKHRILREKHAICWVEADKRSSFWNWSHPISARIFEQQLIPWNSMAVFCARNTVDASTPGAASIKMGVRQHFCFLKQNAEMFLEYWDEARYDIPMIWRSDKKCLFFCYFYQYSLCAQT